MKAGPELLDHTISLANEATLQSFWETQKKAIASKDISLLCSSFGPVSRLTSLAGGQFHGIDAIEKFWETSLDKLGPKAKMKWRLLEIHQNSPRTATLHGQWELDSEKLPTTYPRFGYFLEELHRELDQWQVKRSYFWPVTEGHTRHLRPKAID